MGSILSTRLHACTAQRKFDKALKLVNQERASKVDKLGNLPLHIACITGAPIGLIESLVAAFPDGIYARDKNESVPLHYAVRNCSEEVIECLIAIDSNVIMEKDKLGNTPLHNACFGKVSKDLIEKFLLQSPESGQIKNIKGQRAVEYALFYYDETDPHKDLIIIMLQRTPAYWLEKIVGD